MRREAIKLATMKKIERGDSWPAQVNHPDVTDVSMTVGRQSLNCRAFDAQFNQVVSLASEINRELIVHFPFFRFTAPGDIHATLLTLHRSTPMDFETNKLNVLINCLKISRIYREKLYLELNFNELILTENGCLILAGESNSVSGFRDDVYKKIPTRCELKKDILHITLGRLGEEVKGATMYRVNRHLHHLPPFDLSGIRTFAPCFVVAEGSLSATVNEPLTKQFNEVWP